MALATHFGPGRATVDRATVSDANVVLGRLAPEHFLGGTRPLHAPSARRALAALAAELGVDEEEAAWAIIRVANANMARAARRVSVERGHDPRRFTLVAFGGGGPLHACELAEELRAGRVLVPLTPGALSALGLVVAPPRRDYSQAVPAATAADPDRLAALMDALATQAQVDMAAEGHEPATLALRFSLDARYVGQSHELNIPWRPGDSADAVAAGLHATHAARYGYARPEAAVEIVTARLEAVVGGEWRLETGDWETGRLGDWRGERGALGDTKAEPIGRRPVWFAGGWVETALYMREQLRSGDIFPGPAVVYQYDTTTLIPPGWQAMVDGGQNLIITN
jgi:N-methylhydantoinase A